MIHLTDKQEHLLKLLAAIVPIALVNLWPDVSLQVQALITAVFGLFGITEVSAHAYGSRGLGVPSPPPPPPVNTPEPGYVPAELRQ